MSLTSIIRFFLSISIAIVPVIQDRIIGGSDAELGQFPHHVLMFRNGSYVCGGSIISNNTILSAAHCVAETATTPYPPEMFQIVAGTIHRSTTAVLSKVESIIINHSFSVIDYKNDVALLRLSEPLTFSDYINSVELYWDPLPPESEVVIAGFGRLYDDGPMAETLQYTTVQALSEQDCMQESRFYYDGLLCLIHAREKGACYGDEGGSALYEGKLVGVGNFVYPRCGSSSPDGYAKISYFQRWIRQNSEEQ